MERFDTKTMASIEAAIIASERASGTNPTGLPRKNLTEEQADWLAAAHFFSFSENATSHPDAIVSALAAVQEMQVKGTPDRWPKAVQKLLLEIDDAPQEAKETIGASALLSIARLALRTGAWHLLAATLSEGLARSRLRPQRRRLSVATGLVAEWALSAGNVPTAFTYAKESLRHGAETQRIKGYLGMIYALADRWDHAFLYLRDALASQKALSSIVAKIAFGEANLIKAYALHATRFRNHPSLRHAQSRFFEASPQLSAAASPFPEAIARLSIAFACGALEGGCAEDVTIPILALERAGRWRDRILCSGVLGSLPPFSPGNEEVIQALNALSGMLCPARSLVDSALTDLPIDPMRLPRVSAHSLPLVFFCI